MPVFNEELTVRDALEGLLKTKLSLTVQVIVVDDGSWDGSVEAISNLVDDQQVMLIRHPRNLGKGAAIRSGLARAAGTFVTILDADLEVSPSEYEFLLEPLTTGEATVVFGTRTFGSHNAYSFWYVLGNKLLALWASFLFNTWLTDIETCFKMAPLEVWRSVNLRSQGFGFEAEVTGKFLKAGHRIFEVPIGYSARSREGGKKLRNRDGFAALWILLRVRLFGR